MPIKIDLVARVVENKIVIEKNCKVGNLIQLLFCTEMINDLATEHHFSIDAVVGNMSLTLDTRLSIDHDSHQKSMDTPILPFENNNLFWYYKHKIYKLYNENPTDDETEEIILRIKLHDLVKSRKIDSSSMMVSTLNSAEIEFKPVETDGINNFDAEIELKPSETEDINNISDDVVRCDTFTPEIENSTDPAPQPPADTSTNPIILTKSTPTKEAKLSQKALCKLYWKDKGHTTSLALTNKFLKYLNAVSQIFSRNYYESHISFTMNDTELDCITYKLESNCSKINFKMPRRNEFDDIVTAYNRHGVTYGNGCYQLPIDTSVIDTRGPLLKYFLYICLLTNFDKNHNLHTKVTVEMGLNGIKKRNDELRSALRMILSTLNVKNQIPMLQQDDSSKHIVEHFDVSCMIDLDPNNYRFLRRKLTTEAALEISYILNEIKRTKTPISPTYKSDHIAFAIDGDSEKSTICLVSDSPKKKNCVQLEIRVHESPEIDTILQHKKLFKIPYGGNYYRFMLTKSEFSNHRGVIKDLLARVNPDVFDIDRARRFWL